MVETQLSLHFPPAIARQVATFLHHARTASLATVGEQGDPHAANVQFAHDDDLRFYWVSSPKSGHSRNLAARPNVAVTVYGHDDRPMNIHGLQMRGRAVLVEADLDRHRAWNAFVDKFADLAENPRFRELIESQQFYRFQPTWVRWIDNRRGFGFKVEAELK
ncbi:pyridoxamine 5'-phosphate oxidase family protein [Phycisphaerales bacterium AB-hyl4]|uniref:Pyridoxamine 5'-phosphate oxidase family protein n=1 Tax=Natronomicrosphaera hydrolytica TaxID=3242702 RepID=A0ABV4U9K8_9BACT